MTGSSGTTEASPSADARMPARAGGRFPDLGPRVASGIVLIVVALWTAYHDGRPFALLWWAAAVAIAWEWQRLIGGGRFRFRFIVAGIAVSLAASLTEALLVWVALTVLLTGSVVVAIAANPDKRLLSGSGVFYAGALVVAVDLLRQSFPFGFEAIVWLFAVVWGTDVMAYVGGRLIGGPKLWSRISPSKTWAGFLVGIGCGSLAGLAVAPAPGRYGIYIILGLAVGAIAQGGDLFESSLKRRFGAKDSSRLIPGHGGVMDRLDGFLTAAVFAAVLGSVRYGVEAPGVGLFTW